MTRMNVEQVVRNIDRRLDRVEQILPTLPTREEMHAAMRQAVAPLATREELDQKLAGLATKEELQEAFERSRRYTQTHFESLKDDIRLLAQAIANVQASLDQIVRPTLDNHEHRIIALETSRGPAPVRRRG